MMAGACHHSVPNRQERSRLVVHAGILIFAQAALPVKVRVLVGLV